MNNELSSPPFGAGLSAADLQSRAVSGSIWTALHTAVAAPVAFAVNAIVARVLGASGYGDLAFLTLALALIGQATHFGLSEGIIQWGAVAETRGDRNAADSLLSKSMGYHVLVQLPLLTAAILVLAHHDSWLVRGALLLSVALPAFMSSAGLSLTIENRTAGAAKVAIVSNAVSQLVIALTAVNHGTPGSVWAARSIAGSILLPLNFILLDRARRRVAVRIGLPLRMPAGLWRFSFFTWAAGLLSTLVFSRSEVLLLSWLSAPAAVGVFALAYGMAAQITAPVDAIVGPLVPAVAGLLASHSANANAALLRTVRVASLLSGGVTAIGLPCLYEAIPLLYGSGFVAVGPLFLALGVTSCFQSICNPVVVFTRARRRTGVLLGMTGAALLVNFVLALTLVPQFNVWGAAAANSGAVVVFFVLALRHELPVHGVCGRAFIGAMGSWLIALSVATVAIFLTALVPLPATVKVLVAGLMGSAGYLFGLWVSSTGLTQADVGVITAALPARVGQRLIPFLRLLSQQHH